MLRVSYTGDLDRKETMSGTKGPVTKPRDEEKGGSQFLRVSPRSAETHWGPGVVASSTGRRGLHRADNPILRRPALLRRLGQLRLSAYIRVRICRASVNERTRFCRLHVSYSVLQNGAPRNAAGIVGTGGVGRFFSYGYEGAAPPAIGAEYVRTGSVGPICPTTQKSHIPRTRDASRCGS